MSTGEWNVVLSLVLSLYIFLAKSHAALRAQFSCLEVSSCVLSSNLGAQGVRSWGSHFWIIPWDGPFISRIIIWYQVHPECVTVRPAEAFNLNSPTFRDIDFIGSESWDTQPIWTSLYFRMANAPWVPSFFDFLPGQTFARTASDFRLVVKTHGRMSITTWRFIAFLISIHKEFELFCQDSLPCYSSYASQPGLSLLVKKKMFALPPFFRRLSVTPPTILEGL